VNLTAGLFMVFCAPILVWYLPLDVALTGDGLFIWLDNRAGRT
jgi:hypothetical protein